uniref:Uncharacterized protein n=1 Tax=Tanacetum cinerariifolium TaxID=118510 RepID=A0A699IPC5_TANCI|nr:hypothetical protein [Tanacetum cinerariifolium]
MTLLNTLLETCATLTKQVANLEQDKIAQAIEITKLKQRFRRLEKKIQFKSSRLKRLRKVGITQRVESSTDTDTVMDDQEDASKQRGKIAELDADEDVTLDEVDAEVAMDADVQGRLAESQAKVYHLDLEHAEKVLSMQDTDEAEPAEVEEVIEVVTAAKLMTEDEAFAKQLEAKLNANINWNDVIEHVKRKEKQDNTVMRYQALKKDPITEAQARKNMMIYLKNMAGIKMDFFKGMTYNEIRPIFEKHYNLKQAFLERVEEEVTEKEEPKTHLQIVANDDDVYTKATPLALKRRFGDAFELVQERFQSSEPKNFSDDFMLNTLKIMFEKLNIEASIWRDQRGIYGLAKFKRWKLFESCGVHILTLTTTQMILVVEKKYPLTRFTLKQMLNNVRLEAEEKSEMSLELLRLVRRQLQAGYILE